LYFSTHFDPSVYIQIVYVFRTAKEFLWLTREACAGKRLPYLWAFYQRKWLLCWPNCAWVPVSPLTLSQFKQSSKTKWHFLFWFWNAWYHWWSHWWLWKWKCFVLQSSALHLLCDSISLTILLIEKKSSNWLIAWFIFSFCLILTELKCWV